jgi:hypothetical protein
MGFKNYLFPLSLSLFISFSFFSSPLEIVAGSLNGLIDLMPDPIGVMD